MKLKLVSIFLLMAVLATAQKKAFKFGKPSLEEVQSTSHAAESEAEAAILYKKERLTYDYNSNDGFITIRDVQFRIKIYKKDGLPYGTIPVPLYVGRKAEERISGIKGYTYNMVDGKVEDVKLKKDAIFTENVNNYRNKVTIVMPEVKEGSLIDVEYRITSELSGNIDQFQFQYGIPVDFVDVTLNIPEYFIFKKYTRGFYPIDIRESKQKRQIDYTYRPKVDVGSDKQALKGVQRRQLDFFENVYIVNAQNIPSLKEEDFTDNIDNYRSSIKFELASTNFPSVGYKNYSRSWDDVAKTLYAYDDFGPELRKTKVIKNDVDVIKQNTTGNDELLFAIFEYVKNRMTWNGYVGVGCEKGIKKAYEERTGNVAEINLMLTTMLRYAGLNANPVLVSTKKHGIPLFPTNEGFNYVVAAVEYEGATILLDATERMAPINVLPKRALNWYGRIIREDGSSKQINLHPKRKSSRLIAMNAKLQEDGTVEGKMRTRLTDAFAFEYRDAHNKQDKEAIMAEMEKKYLSMDVEGLELKNEVECNQPLVESYSFVKENQAEIVGSKLLFKPALFLTTEENPFKLENREYPVDFSFPQAHKIVVNFTIPEGYTIESMPENISMAMPDGLASFNYALRQSNNQVQFNFTMDINSAIISPMYYKSLKEFYNQVVVKQSEPVVLSKI